MSDSDLVQVLDAMERILEGKSMDPETLAAWRESFDAALAAVERGSEWSGIVTRAHALSARLDAAADALAEQRDQVRREMDLQTKGARALKGYKPA